MNKSLYLSKEMKDALMDGAKPSEAPLYGYGFPVHESSLFPFEIHYDACDVESRSEIKIPSGEWVHGAIVPQEIEIPKLSWEFSFDLYKHSQRSFFAANWGAEIFKF